MANKSLTMVNQKLAHARAIMALLEAQADPTNASQRLQQQALLDAGAFHLTCAYSHYLRELGENYALPRVAQIDSEEELRKAFAAQGKSPAELQELEQLVNRNDSWLSSLKAAYQGCWQLVDSQPAPDAARIQVVDLDASAANPEPVSRARLLEWHRDLNDLIARQRETSAEY